MENCLKNHIEAVTEVCKPEDFSFLTYYNYFKGCKFGIYPFTTENISGYIKHFELRDRSLLTVGSSGDQVFNAILHGCKDITLVDSQPLARYYFYLKFAALISLSYDEFLSYLRYFNYPVHFEFNRDVFNMCLFDNIRSTLKNLDIRSYYFWNKIFGSCKPENVRSRLFENDEGHNREVIGCNDYLKSYDEYEKAKKSATVVTPKFIFGDVFHTNYDRKFDNIWLSNIAVYLKLDEIRTLTDKMSAYLSHDAKLMISYLYDTTVHTSYKDYWPDVYNLPTVLEILSDYAPEIITFKGTEAIEKPMGHSNVQDSIMVHSRYS